MACFVIFFLLFVNTKYSEYAISIGNSVLDPVKIIRKLIRKGLHAGH